MKDIVEIWEVYQDDANTLIKLGWELLQIVPLTKSEVEEGVIHSKLVGIASEIAYVMGRTANIPARKNDYEGVYDYKKRVETQNQTG